MTPNKSRFPYTDLKPTINKFLHTKWQQRRNNNIHNKLFQIKPTLGEWGTSIEKIKKRTSYIAIANWSYKTNSLFIRKQEPQPQCLTCRATFTVKHILIECGAFAVIWKRFFKVNSKTDPFENVKIVDVLSLRETELYQKKKKKKMTNYNWLILCKQMEFCL